MVCSAGDSLAPGKCDSAVHRVHLTAPRKSQLVRSASHNVYFGSAYSKIVTLHRGNWLDSARHLMSWRSVWVSVRAPHLSHSELTLNCYIGFGIKMLALEVGIVFNCIYVRANIYWKGGGVTNSMAARETENGTGSDFWDIGCVCVCVCQGHASAAQSAK